MHGVYISRWHGAPAFGNAAAVSRGWAKNLVIGGKKDRIKKLYLPPRQRFESPVQARYTVRSLIGVVLSR